jgi:serine/threonine protein kinase
VAYGVTTIELEASMQAGLRLSGRYGLQKLLGRGGMGEVWRGIDEQLDRPVAVKVLREHFTDPELAERFRREARIAARLQHPGITVVHDIGSDNGQPFIIMELLHGRDLAAILQGTPAGMPVDTIVSLAVQATEALQAAHAGHVVHRDLKPANLFVLDAGQLKICDFGIARAIDATTHLTALGQVIGTPAYMSPEQCEGQQADERSDLYSIGCVLYELLTGRPPFAEGQPLAIMLQHVKATPAAPRTIRPDLPRELDNLVMELLAKDPAHRPAGAGHVTETLRALRYYTPTLKLEVTAKASSLLDVIPQGVPGNATSFQPTGSDGPVSAIRPGLPSAPPSQSPAITRVPRTEAERRQLPLARPVHWEYLYFAGQLLHERSSAEMKRRNHELGYARANRDVIISGEIDSSAVQLNNADDIFDFLAQQLKGTVNLAQRFAGLINDKAALERAFGAPGQEGDPERLAGLAKRWNNVYEEFLDWAASIRGVRVPPEFRNLRELAARYGDEPAEKYHAMVDEYVTKVDGIYDSIAASIVYGKSIKIDVKFTLSGQEVMKEYVTELNRLRSLRLDL